MDALSYSIPAPTGGWNDRDELDLMPEQDAVRLVNAFPDVNKVSSRNGFSSHNTSDAEVQTLVEYAQYDGTRKIIGADDGDVRDYTTASSPTTLGTGFTNNKWQTATYLNQIVFVNGADQPQKYDGTTFGNATYTGIADDSVLINVSVYKNRLYFIEKESTSIWYGGAASVTGALTELDIGDVLKLGGKLLYAGSVSQDTGSGLQDIFAIITDKGEVVIYNGTNPGNADWTISGRFYIPAPLGAERCAFNLYGDLGIITEAGVFSLSSIMSSGAVVYNSAITDKIQNAFNNAAKLYGSNFGWQGIVIPRSKWLLINIPVSSSQSHQYVMNLLNGSWCKFTGMNAKCWGMLSEVPYFGTTTAVLKADSGKNDNGAAINVDIKQAFNYFENRQNTKQFLLCKPVITANGAIQLELGLAVDNQDTTTGYSTIGAEATSGGKWNTFKWNTTKWAGGRVDISNWDSIFGLGRSAAVKLKSSLTNVQFDFTATHITYKVGGIL